ncbi:hypothetical protein CsSME_00022235 [Camellia sinensis var. sinensis]
MLYKDVSTRFVIGGQSLRGDVDQNRSETIGTDQRNMTKFIGFSIFGEEKALIDTFEPATMTVKEISGTVDGVKIKVFEVFVTQRSHVVQQSIGYAVDDL